MLPLKFRCDDGLKTRDAFLQPNDKMDSDALELLNSLRMVALACRCAARTDVTKACAVLSHDRNVATEAFAEALVRCLGQVLEHTPHFNRPSVNELSFDEQWLMRLVQCHRTGDTSSFVFLLRSRLPAYAQRNVGFLIGAVSDHLGKN